MIASATRLQLRSVKFLFPFIIQVARVKSQLKNMPGCQDIEIRKTNGFAFWTKTAWKDIDSLTAFSQSDAHKMAMPKLKEWCDEAVHAHWKLDSELTPSWTDAEIALEKYGKLSTLDNPSSLHKAGKINLA